MIRLSRPETNEEVFQIAGSDQNMVELVKLVARMMPRSVEWDTEEPKNGRDTDDRKEQI